MKDFYDVAVLGCWWGANYGSVLNGYAVYKVLKSMGLSVLMVHKHNANENDWEITNTHNARFIEKFYPKDEVSPIIPFSELHTLNKCCDAFLTGSDQIWNYGINKIFDMVFMQNFVEDSKKKISFGTSFGHGKDNTPSDKLPHSIELLKRFHAISVREKSGADICRDTYGVKAQVVVEPVFCLDVTEYKKLAKQSTLVTPQNPYILTYILDPTPQKRQAIVDYGNLMGMEVINVLDGDPRVYDANKEKLNLSNTLGKIGAEDFMKLYDNASYVISDSFHGTAFAIIFNKRFLSITNYRRGAVRFKELLGKFGLLGQLIENPEEILVDLKYTTEIDYSKVNKIIEKERNESIKWLKNVIETPIEKMKSIEINNVLNRVNKDDCMGCSACANICPVDAIYINADKLGYYKPIIDNDKCINCGKCVQICPTLQLPKKNNKLPTCFAFIAKDKNILSASTSGGVFSLLAHEVFKRKGYVVGAAWKEDHSVQHIMIDNISELYKLQKSKYLQSYIGNIFKEIKNKLEQGKFVLFSGCPCQVAGLKKYLDKEYDKLILIDILCANSPSPMFFKKYIEDSFPQGILEYGFRHKREGEPVNCETVIITKHNGERLVRRGAAQDNYQRVFHNHTMCASHCENCKYQSIPRYGDLTIGDFWGYSKYDNSVNTKDGISVVLCNSEKGRKFFDEIPQESISVKKIVPLEWLGGNGYAIKGKNYSSPYRDRFFKAIEKTSFSEAIEYAFSKQGVSSYPNAQRSIPLQYNTAQLHFKVDLNMWEEHFINGVTVLTTKQENPPFGYYASIQLMHTLIKGKKYRLSVRFKVKTTSNDLAFHLKEGLTKKLQVIYIHKVNSSDGITWVEITKEFIPNADVYNEFMIGAAHIRGKERFLAIDYIDIREE